MSALLASPLLTLADASAASSVMHSFITPAMTTLCVLASLACVFFLVSGGIQYTTSAGKPENLEHAKKVIKNALIGLVLVLAAATLTTILSNAYTASGATPTNNLPALTQIKPAQPSGGLVDVLINAVVGFLRNIIESIGQPFVSALNYFTKGTPLMGNNPSVFNMWLAVIGIADVLFVGVVALLGFQVMSFSALGFDELDIRQLLPQLALVFLLVNTSIFAIDGVISLSNAMIHAMTAAFPQPSIWDLLVDITKQSTSLGLAGLLVMLAFLVLTIMLLVYYVGRLITLYIGAILSPLILLLWLLPAFKDFAMSALKIYLTTIFVLFVQVVIMELASSMFSGMIIGSNSGQPNTLMALIVGLATVIALLKTQGVMKELSYAASTPRAAREMAGSFMRGFSYMHKAEKTTVKTFKSAQQTTKRFRDKVSTKKPNATPGNSDGSTDTGASGTSRSKRASTAPPLKTGETRRSKDPSAIDRSFTPEELGLKVEPKPTKQNQKGSKQ